MDARKSRQQLESRVTNLGTAYPTGQVREIAVTGQNFSEGMPRSCTLNSNEILEALALPLQGIVNAVRQALAQTPPDLGSDVAERGIVLTGGGALLRDIDKLIPQETGLPVLIADDPLTCVARGGGRALELAQEHGRGDFGRPVTALVGRYKEDSNFGLCRALTTSHVDCPNLRFGYGPVVDLQPGRADRLRGWVRRSGSTELGLQRAFIAARKTQWEYRALSVS